MQKRSFGLRRIAEGLQQYRHIFLLLVFGLFLWKMDQAAGDAPTQVFSEEVRAVVVIDAGHGGVDPGKVGVAGTLEKDINLAVAQKLKELLLADRIRVVMTRESDEGLYSEQSSNKKREDMAGRVRIIEEANPDLVISIHQNSYPDESCKGAQMFYYKNSETGKTLAQMLQTSFLEVLQDENRRQEKANTDYYLLRKTSCPVVIAECGFLSSSAEEALLKTEEYQKKLAEALHLGIMRYLSLEQKEDGTMPALQ